MTRRTRPIAAVLYSVATLWLCSACTQYSRVKSERVVRSDFLTQQSIEEGGIGVVAMTSVYYTRHMEVETAMGDQLEAQIHDAYPAARITKSGDIAATLGRDAASAVHDSYLVRGELSMNELRALRSLLLPDPRYIVLGRIELYGLETDTNLKMIVSFDVYDLTTGENAWSGSLRSVADVVYESHAGDDSQVQIVYGDEQSEFWSMLNSIFNEFARKLSHK